MNHENNNGDMNNEYDNADMNNEQQPKYRSLPMLATLCYFHRGWNIASTRTRRRAIMGTLLDSAAHHMIQLLLCSRTIPLKTAGTTTCTQTEQM